MTLEKAVIINTSTGERTEVQFNPEEYAVNRDVNFAQTTVPGLPAPITQFVSGNMQTLEMELFFDTVEKHTSGSRDVNQAGDDVRNLVNQFISLMDMDAKTHAPPVLLFTWGKKFSFRCVLARASQRYIMFNPDGTPVRARVQVTFNEYRNPKMELRAKGADLRSQMQSYVSGMADNLSSLAGQMYGDPGLWRPIALQNNIDNPLDLPAGQSLQIPPLPFRDPQTGELFDLP